MAVTGPDVCPLVELSREAETTIESVDSNVRPGDCDETTVEFSMVADAEPDVDLTPIFSHGSTDRYRLTLEGPSACPCECLGRFDCPVARYVARDGTLTLTFYAADYDQLREISTELYDRYSDIEVKRLLRSPAGAESEDRVFVDRSKLTSRQAEVLETAYEMGYFQRPRRANATEIAAELGVNPSTFSEHLAAAERKIFEELI